MKLSYFLLAASISTIIFYFLLNSGRNYSERNDYNYVRQDVFRKRLLAYQTMWLEDVKKYIPLKNKKDIQVLIIFSEKKEKGCAMCFKWESEWWYRLMKDNNLDSLVDVIIVLYDSDNLEQTKRILNVCNIDLPIIVDSSSSSLGNMNIEWTPAVFILYQSKVIYHYLSDMNNRDFSRININKFIEFIHLVNKKAFNLNKK